MQSLTARRVAGRFAGLTAAAVLLLGGCGSPAARPASAPHPHATAPAPADPDLGTVMERFYGDVEGGHWAIAYAMLSPRYRHGVSRAAFEAGYARFADLEVALRQTGARTVVAVLTVQDRAEHARRHRLEERWTLRWDGDGWELDELRRRAR